VSYSLATGDALEIVHHGRDATIEPERTLTLETPPAPQREAPTQPPGRAPAPTLPPPPDRP
jgi:alpha,alpha-trehalose phosphorylase